MPFLDRNAPDFSTADVGVFCPAGRAVWSTREVIVIGAPEVGVGSDRGALGDAAPFVVEGGEELLAVLAVHKGLDVVVQRHRRREVGGGSLVVAPLIDGGAQAG